MIPNKVNFLSIQFDYFSINFVCEKISFHTVTDIEADSRAPHQRAFPLQRTAAFSDNSGITSKRLTFSGFPAT